jgi:hypothetical protein
MASTICRVTSLGAAAPGNQHATDDQIGTQHMVFDVVPVGKHGDHARAEQTIHAPQDVEVAVDDHHLRTAADGDLRRVRADDAATEDDDPRRRHAGDAAEQDAHAAMRLFEAIGAGLHRQAASDFRHRRQQGRPPPGWVTVS